MPESHPHGKDIGANITVIGDLIVDDGALGGIHDEPDIRFYTASFVCGKSFACTVVIVICKWIYTDGGGLP